MGTSIGAKTVVGRVPRPLRHALRWAAFAYFDRRDRRRRQPRRIVWILGHMRSGSTLLMHLLSSHREILGAGERNMVYASPADLRKLEVVAFSIRLKLFRDYGLVVDQINHTRMLPRLELLNEPRLLKIFLLRRPAAAVASMVEVLGAIYGMTRDEAVAHYLDRLRALTEYCTALLDPPTATFVSYEDLIHEPDATLARLTRFLGLASPLSSAYRLFGFTGSRGDPSERIRAGRIRDDLPSRRVDLDDDVRERLEREYSRARAVLAERLSAVPAAASSAAPGVQ